MHLLVWVRKELLQVHFSIYLLNSSHLVSQSLHTYRTTAKPRKTKHVKISGEVKTQLASSGTPRWIQCLLTSTHTRKDFPFISPRSGYPRILILPRSSLVLTRHRHTHISYLMGPIPAPNAVPCLWIERMIRKKEGREGGRKEAVSPARKKIERRRERIRILWRGEVGKIRDGVRMWMSESCGCWLANKVLMCCWISRGRIWIDLLEEGRKKKGKAASGKGECENFLEAW